MDMIKLLLWILALFIATAEFACAETLDRPSRVTADATGNVYVSEQPAGVAIGAVVAIAPSGMVTTRIRSSGSTISDPGYFSSVRDLALDASGNLNLLDGVQERILRLSPAGTPLGAIPLPANSNASAFVFLPNGDLLVADAGSGRVIKLDATG